jgi:glycolate oxidase iron-sulfur subunit
MRHAIPVDELEPTAAPIVAAVESCVHCGFCLPTCPTYVTLGEEMDSPRGRILLAKGVLEGTLELEDALPFLDNCLGCQACVTACPSGVQYGDMINSFRAHSEPRRHHAPLERVQRLLVHATLLDPARFRLAAGLGALARPLARRRRFRRALPDSLGAMFDALPAGSLPAPQPLPHFYPAEGPRRARVALLAGCVQQALDPDIGWATLRVLARNGVETVIPSGQGCCGALDLHTGQADRARALARRNLTAFAEDVDAIVTNTAGCGSGMRDYELLFRGEPDHARAARFADAVKDVSAFLHELGVPEAPPLAEKLRIAYHDACHLAHAQGVRDAPRALLGTIPGVEIVNPAEWELCCGSAGTYNVEKPAIARRLGARKATNLRATGAELIAAGNIGCITQIGTHLRAQGSELPVLHTVQILDRAYAETLGDSQTFKEQSR